MSFEILAVMTTADRDDFKLLFFCEKRIMKIQSDQPESFPFVGVSVQKAGVSGRKPER